MDRLNQSIQRGRPVSSVDAARANDVFEHFINAATLKTILGHYRNICELLHLKPNVFPLFYPKLKSHLNSWKAKALWKKFDARAGHKCYTRGKACPNTRVLIIGAGPCGLRTAIEAQLLGAKVVVIEKRDRMSRNNVLHLWPFVIEDLRALGAKKFFGKFCAGAIDHISIRQLQCILLKVALLLGVEVHTEVSFEKVIEPNSAEKIGWRADFKPVDHPVSQYEFDVIIGADGKRNTLQGFRRKEFRGKLAIAITANFINKRTEAEARVEEISGVAFIFNQKFFKELNAETGIDLENIVYYKDDTHYFVMTAKKLSLIDKGVIKQDYADTARLLSPDNVDREALMNYAREAADFSTNYQMPDLEFAVNHYGQPDVAMFDFTSMYAAEYSSKVVERHGYKLLMSLVGDSLLEPFWPTGSGCARGFLSSLDVCWAIKAWGSGQTTPLEVLAERESIYRLLAQTTPENLNKDCKAYTVDPSTRYPNLNRAVLVPQQVLSLYDTDDPNSIELTSRAPQNVSTTETHRKRRRRDIHLDPNTLINWIKEQIKEYDDLIVEDITTSFRDGRVLCAILQHYRPDLLDYGAIKAEDVAKNNQLAFDLLEKEIGISPVMTGEDMSNSEVPDYLSMFSYLTQIYDTFRGEIPHIKHPKLVPVSSNSTNERIEQWLTYSDFKKWKEAEHTMDANVKQNLETKEETVASSSIESISKFIENLRSSDISKIIPGILGDKYREKIELPPPFPPISEKSETDLPEIKEKTDDGFHHRFKMAAAARANAAKANPPADSSTTVLNHISNRSKRHAEFFSSNRTPSVADRKAKKRRSLEKYDMSVEERRKRLEEIAANRAERQNKRRQQRKLQTEQFIKSMQMLEANAKSDSGPFEDYSIFVYRQTAPDFQDRVKDLEKKFTYVPDRENRLPSHSRAAGTDEELAARIKDLEGKWSQPMPADKKPKDLLRAIGKIETTDWNIRQIEKKIMENKMGKPSSNVEKERVPKWNREQFLARQTKMENKKYNRQNSTEAKFNEVDKSIKHLEQRLKEGSVRDLGQNKVASITEKLVMKAGDPEPVKPIAKTANKPVVLPTQGGSEYCHFCQKRVYLMERLSAEGRFFHRGCFRCQYCHTTLRLGSYLFDKDGQYGHRFYCTQHFGMPGELYPLKIEKKAVSEKINREHAKPLDKLVISPIEGVDLLDRVQTPERIEFANLSAGHISSEHDESLSQIDEDEWTDRNFGASTAEVCSSDEEEDSSSLSGSESDNEDAYEEALEEPPTKEGTMRWMERYKQRYSKDRRPDDDSESEDYSSSSDHSSYYENSSGDEEDEPVTEGEEEIRARELRKQEVRVEPPVVQTDTGSDTEIVSDESSPESSSKHNSATEISTDSEFAVDDPTPTREIPSIIFSDFNVTKTRGTYSTPKKVQVKSGILQSPINNGKTQQKRGDIRLEFTPLVPSPVLPKASAPSLLSRTEGYALNRTQSTGGIATKVSLELKKKYLLGDTGMPGSIQKSGSVSTLDSKFKSFQTNISDCQKLLKPAPEISPSMQVFCNKLNERRSPLSPIMSQFSDAPLKSPDVVSPTRENKTTQEQPDVTKCTEKSKQTDTVFEHETEGRPRSPLQEIPIVVPEIDWNQTNKSKDSDISSDSLTSDSDESEPHSGIQKSPTVKIFNSIPRVEVHDDAGEVLPASGDEIALDSLCVVEKAASPNDAPKSISSEKKSLNQPKTLPGLQSDNNLPKIHAESHDKTKSSPEIETKTFTSTGHSTPSDHDSCVEHTGAAMTETELSDWARDSAVSDDFEDVEFELNLNARRNKQPKGLRTKTKTPKAKIEEFDDIGHVCGKEKQTKELKNLENLNNVLSSLEFMDTAGETSSDEKVLVETALKNNGYVEFQNEDEIPEDSLNPNINNIVETINPHIENNLDLENLSTRQKNTGYCIIGNESGNFGSQVIDLKAADVEKFKNKKLNVCENEEDSLLIVETGTTTEENTCSDSTVKNLIENLPEKHKKDNLNVDALINENKALIERIREEQKVVNEKDNCKTKQTQYSNKQEAEYKEHCQRLQSKVEFGNAKDSIDVRKSKRKEKSDLPAKPDLIQEETLSPVHVELESTPISPKVIYTKEEIQKSRDENQKLVQEMVMNKMKAQNKSLERKKRSRNSFSPSLSPSRPFDLSKSATTDLSPQTDKRISTCSTTSSVYSTPDVILTAPKKPLEKSQTVTSVPEMDVYSSTPISSFKQHPKSFSKQLSVHSSFQHKLKSDPLPSEAFSLPDIQQALKSDEFKTPIAPPRQRNEEIRRTAEKLKEDARLKARLKSNEDLGLSPEDKLKKLRERVNRIKGEKENDNVDIHVQDSIESLVINTERRNSLLYSNDTLTKKRNGSFKRSKSGDDTLSPAYNELAVPKLSVSRQSSDVPVRTKSVSEIAKASSTKLVDVNMKGCETAHVLQYCKSDPNLLTETPVKTEKKSKCKDRERRKSITKLITDFFGKKKDSSGSSPKGFLSRISPKSKSKSMTNLSRKNTDKIPEEITRTNSFSDGLMIRNRHVDNVSPPPIPPLPLNYPGSGPSRCTDDSSDGEHDWKHQERSSCDTLDQTSNPEGRRVSKVTRKATRQAQLKRHRMAQEIQRKLEETEVKTRELEQRGVLVEKALRGETQNVVDESDLLKEWFDLMRDLTELRRYERELMVRAQELELEDRHARLQQELRERLDNEEHKTKEDIKVESSIINEMMEIVAKRDSLIALLEEDRLRYSEEDRDFEEQMLVKGLRLTPLQKKLDK